MPHKEEAYPKVEGGVCFLFITLKTCSPSLVLVHQRSNQRGAMEKMMGSTLFNHKQVLVNVSAFLQSKTGAQFVLLKHGHMFVYYPNWNACWKPCD